MIGICVVHNNDIVRNSSIKLQLDQLTKIFKEKNILLEINWIGNQDFFKNLNFNSLDIVKIEIRRILHEYKYTRYRKISIFVNFYNILKSIFRILFMLLDSGKNKKLKSYLETQAKVLYKHDLAIKIMGNSELSDFILFEDDALIRDYKEIASEIMRLIDYPGPKFVNLSNVCKIEDLCIENIILEESESEILLSRPTTNGLCAYYMDYQMAALIIEEREKNQIFRFLPCDYALNEIFINIWKKTHSRSLVWSKLYKDPPVKHGSKDIFIKNSVSSILN